MKMTQVVLTITALACGSLAFAAPKALSGDALDAVSAGSGMSDVLSSFSSAVTPAQTEITDSMTAAAGAATAAASNGSSSFSGAVADHNAVAVNGFENFAIKVDLCVPLDNVANFNFADGFGAAAIYGNSNETSIDNSSVFNADIAAGSDGVIARKADISNSFNVDATDIDVDADINGSFNTVSSKVDISGQNCATAITNANAGGDAQVGASLNVTNATASVATVGTGLNLSVPFISGNAVALTVAGQFVINNVVTVGVTVQ